MLRTIIIGAGGHARVAIDVFREQCPKASLEGLISSDNDLIGSTLDGVTVIGDDSDLDRLYDAGVTHAFVAIGNNKRRIELVSLLSSIGYKFVTLIHPCAFVSKQASLGRGSLVVAGAVINAGARVGEHVIINTQSSVDHDCIIEGFTHISPGVHLAGGTRVLIGAHVGIGAVTIPGITIGEWSVIGAGSTVIRDIPSKMIAFGTPCSPVRSLSKMDE